jgi:hypothetical protein
MILLKLMILIIICIHIKYIYDMIQYDSNAQLTIINDNPKFITMNMIKSPILMKTTQYDMISSLDSLQKIVPGYMLHDNDKIISLDDLLKSDTITIHRNKKIIYDFELQNYLEKTLSSIKCELLVGADYSLSIYRNNHIIELSKNKRNIFLIKPIVGNITLYLFNPKHELEIINKSLSTIKKWGIKTVISSNEFLLIPPEWYYAYETHNDTILSFIESDTYFTYLFNYIRK